MSWGKELSGNVGGELSNWGHQEQAVLTLYRPRFCWWFLHLPIPVVHVMLCFVSGNARITIKKLEGKHKEAYYYANFCFENLFFPPNGFLLPIYLGFTLRTVLVLPACPEWQEEDNPLFDIPGNWHVHSEDCTSCIYAAQCYGLFLCPWSLVTEAGALQIRMTP